VKRGAYQHLIGSRASATLFRVGTNTDLGVSWSVSSVFEKVPARSLTVCAWPEPPCARPAEPSAGVRSERLASADVFKLPVLVAHLSSFSCRDVRESH
jgi:hypothetical protein